MHGGKGRLTSQHARQTSNSRYTENAHAGFQCSSNNFPVTSDDQPSLLILLLSVRVMGSYSWFVFTYIVTSFSTSYIFRNVLAEEIGVISPSYILFWFF